MNTLQTKLARLNAQLLITKGNRNKAKIVIDILKVELAIEQLKPVIAIRAKKEATVKKDKFCKKAEKETVKLLQSRFKNAKVNVTETKVNITSESAEISVNSSFLLNTDYYEYNRETKISKLKKSQTAKVHAIFEFIGTVLLAS